MLILLAEDDPAHAAAIQRAVEASGSESEVKVVGTLREFRQSSVERPPNIAVMDLNLPDGRATEVLTQPPEAGPFPILVMTSYGNEQVAVEAIKAGALEYVVKSPEAFADMPHTIAHALHEWNLLQERKQAEAALEFKNIILATQQEASLDGILVVDENGGIISFNRRFVDIWGIPLDMAESKADEQVLQSVMDKLVNPEEFVGKLEQLFEDQDETSRDEIALKDGRTFDRYSAPMLGEGGKHYGRVWYFRDITDRKRAEEKLQQSEEHFRLLAEHAPTAIFVQTQYRFAYLNPAALKCFGAETAGQLLGQPVLDRFDARFHERVKERIRLLNEEKQAVYMVEQIYLKMDGSTFDVEVSAAPIRWGGHDGALVFFRDITGRKKAEKALQASQERLGQIFEASPNVTSVFRIEGQNLRRTWVSPNLERLFGYTVEEALQPHWWSAHVHPEDLARVITESGRILAHEHIVHEYRFLRRDGRVVWINDELHLLRNATDQPSEVVGAWTDLPMPVMDGPAFIRVLRRLNPPVRVIAVSGTQSKSHLPADLGVPDEARLSKPFSGAMLLQTLQRVLHPEAPPKH
jgi:PAS domain S-box-containing protein